MGNIIGFLTLCIVSLGIALFIYLVLKNILINLLDEIIKLPSATILYIRIFCICLFFITLSAIFKTNFDLEAGKPFMEFVWRIADGLSDYFGNVSLFFLFYTLLVTVLVVALRRRNDK